MHDSFWALISLVQQLLILLHFVLVITFAVRVIMQRLPVGASLAWLLVLALLPYVGVVLYLLFGERFLGVKHQHRRARLRQLQDIPGLRHRQNLDYPWQDYHPAAHALATLEFQTAGIPPLGGNEVNFLQSAQSMILAMCVDIRAAEKTCHMEFYIWHPGGIADQVADALLDAANRGVRCRVMLDAVGSARFFKSPLFKRLQHPNIEVIKACPIGLVPAALGRYDLRSHRKTLIVDDRVAYIGSFNLIDPTQFKQSAAVGEWIDLMARIEGPLAPALNAVYCWYWNIESGQNLPLLENPVSVRQDKTVAQIAPSGPDNLNDSILQSLLQGIYSATTSVDIITPYFVPGEALEQALIIAAKRGVSVTVIVPERVDSFLVRHASRSYFDSLMNAGVNIFQFRQGLLHSKCTVIDRKLAFFGTVNLDLRSLWLNFEMTLIMYDAATAERLAHIVDDYRQQAIPLDPATWHQRHPVSRFFENITHLFSPLI
ncbi:cardiolipin synthase [Cellvibrio polysaccharolyticus]|uniref:Cardiolipin synthase A n=1 Tax=Cellvibrio polysaccharolyticus TaxID=2082724 RepID=A0A928V3Q8_9GAMM|nr:cardiolipin synthase [Cellvibrio polysaccharolyticus]MBE8716079.1 cardiolipin synthase [Cellvibrio polysaccharolyticus]